MPRTIGKVMKPWSVIYCTQDTFATTDVEGADADAEGADADAEDG